MSEVRDHRRIPLSAREAWKSMLEDLPHAFGHTWESCNAMQMTSGNESYLYCYTAGNTKIVCPVSERRYGSSTDIVTPYGFSGFVGRGDWSNFRPDWLEFVRDNHYVCGFIQLCPGLVELSNLEGPDLHQKNTVYILNLTLKKDELYSRLSTNRRRELRTFEAREGRIRRDKDELIGFFTKHYHDFMRRRNGSLTYEFSQQTLQFLLNLENVLLLGAGSDEVEAVSVFGFTPSRADYLFNVSLPQGQRYSAVLIWHAMEQLKERRVPTLNLGGGIKAGDGIALFKERFGGCKMPSTSLRQVYDRDTYEDLCRKNHLDPQDLGGYFPPYRDPLMAVNR